MCGIFGAIGSKINPGIIRALALVNRERGTDSLGMFTNTGKIIKRASDPIACLGDADFADFIARACGKGWFLAGHTRFATRGGISSRNAHPFRYGRIVGVHNGVVSAPAKYAVDSEYLFDALNAANGDYQKAFADISGYWALAWFDGSDFYLQAHHNEVAIGRDDHGVWYYSSEWEHLEACAGRLSRIALLGSGDTIRFTMKCRTYQKMPRFRSGVREKPVVVAGTLGTVKVTHTARISKSASSSDAFYVEEDELWGRTGDDRWAGVDDYSNAIREYYE
jgi:glutamine phosphoribosylpyrophosphate amidotransferase